MKAPEILSRLGAVWDRLERWLIGLLGMAALGIANVQVFSRYVDPDLSINWGDEVTVYLIIWALFVTTSPLVRDDGHVRSDIVLRILPVSWQRGLEIFNCLVALLFCAGLAWYGCQIVADSLAVDERSSAGLSFPMWIYYASLPFGAVLMTLRYVRRLVKYVAAFDPNTMAIKSGHE